MSAGGATASGAAGWDAPLYAYVADVREEMADVATLELTLADAPGAVAPAPGQFAMLYAFGVGEAAISFSGDPAQPSRLVHTIRRVGAVSTALTRLGVGDGLGVRGPFGQGWPMQAIAGRDLVVMAGGLGLAPLRPVMLSALRGPARPRRLTLLCGAREPELILYRDELDRWRREGAEVLVTVDHASPGWDGDVGLVTALVARAGFEPENAVAFVCGPEVMMRFSAVALEEAGVSAARIWLSMERNMKCAVGLCGHCQFGAAFVCKDGPVFRFDAIRSRLCVREI